MTYDNRPNHGLKRLASSALIAITCTWGASAYALNMGKLTVTSKLDEPFSAVITLNNVSDSEFVSLVPELASKSEFARASIIQLPYLKNMRFESVRDTNGRAQVRVTSDKPITEPYVQFLVALEWSGGKILHEYTALLSPQEYASTTSAITTPSVAEVSPEPADVEQPQVVLTNDGVQLQAPAPAEASGEAPAIASDIAFSGDQYGPVKRGDTLWGIASKIDRPSGVNLNEMMTAIVSANPDAFNNGNQNILLVGSVLSIPGSVTNSVPGTTAIASSDGSSSTGSSVSIDSTQTQEASPSTGQAIADSSSSGQTAESTSEPLLKIVGADLREYSAQDRISAEQIAAARQSFDPNDMPGAVQALTTRIVLLEESILARDLENQELRERMRFLEDKFERSARVLEEFRNAAKVLEFEQPDLALLQNQEPANVEVLGVESADSLAGATNSVEQDGASVADTIEVQANSNVTASVEEILQAANTGAPATDDGNEATPVAALASTWWQRLSSNLAFDAQAKKFTLIGVILASILGLLTIRRRRKSDELQIEKAIHDAENAQEEHSNLSGSSLARAAENVEKEFDPIAEAKVYIAYGRQEEAEQVLRDALDKDPDHPEVALELLDVYRRGNDIRGFSEYASDLKSRWPISHPDKWQRVVDMGREYLPGHELFEDDGLGAVDEDLGLALSSLADTDSEDSDLSVTSLDGENNTEKRNPYLAVDNVSNSETPGSVDFVADTAVSSKVTKDTADVSNTGTNGANNNGNGSTDTDQFDESTVQWDGVGTKINLAKAYIDMGDIENARDLIEQAMKEGSDQQREQASVLATQLAANLHS